ncbi:hypothetical protein AMK68_01565 [candidate division KD3-62 bacterium DG_56]|uniref:DUF503 domain-containing protein n=1 Tax=candidate division KD3-62 bacterium DG_56 TaxID=1704032 RepID=A0A0S7XPX9_9BACT|nr:MAG: hypothetical protein AMK68_01565 [candidate division KD3-62 bacterium DG_56]
MVIGAATFELEITDGVTLKDKRQVVRSLLDRLRHQLRVAAAEVDDLNSRQFATIAVVTVSNKDAVVHRTLAYANTLVTSEPRVQVMDFRTEIL